METFLNVILMIAILGFIVWAITTLIPMGPQFKTAIYAVSGIFLLLFILRAFGFSAFGLVPEVRMFKFK